MSYYYDLFKSLHTELEKYYHRWYFDRPMVVTPQRDEEMHRITNLLNRFLHFYADHYREYLDRIPYSDQVLRFLELQEERSPYQPGSARIDYLIDTEDHIKVCEITSRFFGNGYFTAFIYVFSKVHHIRNLSRFRAFCRRQFPAGSFLESLLHVLNSIPIQIHQRLGNLKQASPKHFRDDVTLCRCLHATFSKA